MAIKDVLTHLQETEQRILVPENSSLGLPARWYNNYEEYFDAIAEKALLLSPPRPPTESEVTQATDEATVAALMIACGVKPLAPQREEKLLMMPALAELLAAGIDANAAGKLKTVGEMIDKYLTHSTLLLDGFETHDHRRDWRKLFHSKPASERRMQMAGSDQEEEPIDKVHKSNPLSGNTITKTSLTIQSAQKVFRKGNQTQPLAQSLEPRIQQMKERVYGYEKMPLRQELGVVFDFNTAIIGIQRTIGEHLQKQGIPIQVKKVCIF